MITELLEIVQVGGINVGFLVGIIGILSIVRGLDKKKHLAGGFYLIAVMVLGMIAGLITVEGGFGDRLIGGIAHAGVASILYQYMKKLIPSKANKTRESDKFVIFRKEV